LVNPPQRAASSTTLVGHKFIVKKTIQDEPPVDIKGPEIWVTHHVDNPKFGISAGMNFNDSTCLISNGTFTKIKYF
jgi:hypothetical protein